MLNTEKITINFIDVKEPEKSVAIERIAPKNVIDLNYFQFACQYHAYNLVLQFIESEKIRVQYEDISKLEGEDNKERLAKHEENVKNVKNVEKIWNDVVTNFKNSLIDKDIDLIFVFEADTFAKTYTTLVLDFDTVYTTKSTKTATKAVKMPSGLYQNRHEIKGAVLKLENMVDRMFSETVPKADKAVAFNPLIDILNNAFGVDTLNKAVYKPANFKDIPVKYWTKYLETLRSGKTRIARGMVCELVPEAILLKNCFAMGLAKLGIVEIANYDTPVERTLELAKKALSNSKENNKPEKTK